MEYELVIQNIEMQENNQNVWGRYDYRFLAIMLFTLWSVMLPKIERSKMESRKVNNNDIPANEYGERKISMESAYINAVESIDSFI